MPVDKFGHTDSGATQRVVSGGVTLSQVNNTFLRRDCANALTEDLNLDSHRLINVKDPSNAQDAATKNYVDNSETDKVSKSGDTITGDLNILLSEDNLRTFGVRDSGPGKSVTLFLGDAGHRIHNNFGNALQIVASHGVKFTGPAGDVCWLGAKFGPKAMFYKSINMNRNYICGLNDPNWEQDAATKNYVDTRHAKNSVGLVPNMSKNECKSGFVVSTSSELAHSPGYHVFNRSEEREWIVGKDVRTNFWIKLKCPEQIRIYKFALRGRPGNPAKHSFKFQGSNDDDNWTDIFSATDVLLDSTVSFFNVLNIDAPTSYCYYRVYITDTEMIKAPGLSYWQIYTLDPIV